MDSDLTFPSFKRLTVEDDPSLEYFDDSGSVWYPRRHWCLVAEIVANRTFMRPEVALKTRHSSAPFKLIFYHEREPHNGFSFDQLKPGHTLCVLYAERKTLMDLTEGIRQESVDTVWVFKAPLAKVHAEAKKILALADAGSDDVEHTCFECGKPDEPEKRHPKCANCHCARYCSKECQRTHWSSTHKALCKDSDKLLRLACIDRRPFVRGKWLTMDTLPPHIKAPAKPAAGKV